MAAKKTTKTVAKAAEVVKNETVAKVEPIKAEVKEEKAPAKAAETKAPAKKAAAKKTVAKKAMVSELHVQFAGKSYAQEDLMKMAKDVWKYDLKQKAGDLTQVELYVKPEENMVYYVMNKEFTGSFYI